MKRRDNNLPMRSTRQSRRILLTLLTDAANLGGGTIWRFSGGSAGRVYAILDQLENAGWVTSDWESPQPSERPRRRFYSFTPYGRGQALKILGLKILGLKITR
jgi:PadR family transcriptional regulator PadR